VSGGVARVVEPHAPADAPPGALAGGTSCLLDVVRRCAGPRTAGQGGTALPLPDVVAAASLTPTRVLWGRGGPEDRPRPTGPLTPGSPADLLVVDQRLRPVHVAVRGAWVTNATTAAQAAPQDAD
jgi:N-acetylglucosamine-6-phosphate deacetylase